MSRLARSPLFCFQGEISMGFLLQWLVGGAAIIITAYLLPGVAVEGFFAGVFSCVVSAVVMRAYDDAARPRVLALLSAAWVVPGLLAPPNRMLPAVSLSLGITPTPLTGSGS